MILVNIKFQSKKREGLVKMITNSIIAKQSRTENHIFETFEKYFIMIAKVKKAPLKTRLGTRESVN